MLGSSLVDECQLEAINFDAPSSKKLDIRKYDDLENYVLFKKPLAIINCAAWTDVENSDFEKSKVYDLNVAAVKKISLAAHKASTTLIHISSDYVFDGTKKGPYSEEDMPNPVNLYGHSKLMGEKQIFEINPDNSFVIRTSWLYGAHGKNFAKKILIKALLQQSVEVVDDQVGSPTNSTDLAKGILAIIERRPQAGIYHFSNSGRTSWYQFARKIYELSKVNVDLVRTLKSKDYPSLINRPANSALATTKWSLMGITKIPYWEDSLYESFPRIFDSVQKEIT